MIFKKITTKLIFLAFVLSLFIIFPNLGRAAYLSENQFETYDIISIHGNGFGSRVTDYSFICFNSDYDCFGRNSFINNDILNWTNTRIDLYIPDGIDVEGEIIVSVEGEEEFCYGNDCYIYKVPEEKARLSYKIKPYIKYVSPNFSAKPGEIITIEGFGFGDTPRRVLFGGRQGEIINWSMNTIEVKVSSAKEDILNGLKVYNKSNLYGEASYMVFGGYTNDTYSIFQEYFFQINLKKAWDEYNGKKTVTVAVIDDGVYVNHPDLRNNIWRNEGEIAGNWQDNDNNGYIDDVLGYNFVDNNSIMETKGFHGTFVASIIGAEIDNMEGIAGVAKDIKIMPLIVSGFDGSFVSDEKIIEAIYYAVDNGADIINLSFGTRAAIGYTDALNVAIRYAYDNDVVMVVAAGNGDIDGGLGYNLNNIPQSPICNNQGSPILLGVASLNNLDLENNGKKKTTWSNYGSNCVNISAPGNSIIGAVPPIYSELGGFYKVNSGTSFSSPLVAGVAALIKSHNPEMKNWEIINRIIYTADNIDEYNPNYKGQLGGRLNAYKALTGQGFSSEIVSVSSYDIKGGDQLMLKIKGYTSDLEIRLESQNYSMAFSSGQIKVEDPETIILNIPKNIYSGEYKLILKEGYKEIDKLEGIKITELKENEVKKDDPKDSVVENNIPSDIVENSKDEIKKDSFLQKERGLIKDIDLNLSNRLRGRILLQVESRGEAWYVNIEDNKRYYMANGDEAYNIMRYLGVGITNNDLNRIKSDKNFAKNHSGKIFLQVEANGEAYYIDFDGNYHYLKNGSAAYDIMRDLGLGITNENIRRLDISEIK